MSESKEVTNQEIDLTQVIVGIFRSIRKMFSFFGKFFFGILSLMLRRWIAMIFIVIFGIISGYTYYKYFTFKYFKTTLIGKVNTIENSEMIRTINDFQKQLQEGNFTDLTKKSGLSETDLKEIMILKATWFIDKNTDGKMDVYTLDTLSKNKNDYFQIDVNVRSNSVVPKLKSGILNYIKSFPFFVMNHELAREHYMQTFNKIDQQLSYLDSAQKSLSNKLKITDKQLLLINEKASQSFHNEIMYLEARKQEMDTRLKLETEPFTVLNDFINPNNPIKEAPDYIINAVLLSIFFGILLLYIIEKYKHILAKIEQIKNAI